MKQFSARSAAASRLRQRKYELIRELGLPENLLGSSFSESYRRCGKPRCRCRSGRGHPMWSVVLHQQGERRVEHVPRDWVSDVEAAVRETERYLNAIKEVMAINLDLMALTRSQEREKKVRQRAKKRQAKGKTAKKRSTTREADRSSTYVIQRKT